MDPRRQPRAARMDPEAPATTPASHLEILHGVIDGRSLRSVVRPLTLQGDRGHRPRDAARSRLSLTTGRGLLVDGARASANLFTGDAPTAALTMSHRARSGVTTLEPSLIRCPAGRSDTLAVPHDFRSGRDRSRLGERYGSTCDPRAVAPGPPRVLRSVTNGALRDSTPSWWHSTCCVGPVRVYVDSWTMQVPTIRNVATREPRVHSTRSTRSYAISAGSPVFSEAVTDSWCCQTTARRRVNVRPTVRRGARSRRLPACPAPCRGLGRGCGGVGPHSRSGRDLATTRSERTDHAQRFGGHAEAIKNKPAALTRLGRRRGTTEGERTFHVFRSGNLGLIYVRGEGQRLTRAQIDERSPLSCRGSPSTQASASSVVLDEVEGPLVLEATAHCALRRPTGGRRPAGAVRAVCADFVLRVALRPEAPDIYVNSLLDAGRGGGFLRDLVGATEGWEVWQTVLRPWPTDLPFPSEPVIGADFAARWR